MWNSWFYRLMEAIVFSSANVEYLADHLAQCGLDEEGKKRFIAELTANIETFRAQHGSLPQENGIFSPLLAQLGLPTREDILTLRQLLQNREKTP